MNQSASTTERAQLINWCRGEEVDSAHAVLMIGIPEGTDIAFIEETMHTIKVFGRVRVRGKTFNALTKSLMVLCECSRIEDPDQVPNEVLPHGDLVAWMLVVADGATIDPGEGVPTSSFQEKLTKLLQEEGKTLHEAQALYPAEALQTMSPEAIIRAVGDILEKMAKSHNENNAYQRLRIFSGSIPTPSGEESFDSWMDQACLMVQECDCSSREKRKRIGESLKGPALEIIQAARDANPDASPMDYLEALEHTFGTPESGEDLYFAFR
ncbi:paraneoplastic antigen Ma1 homolog [Polyodon spathula]|uniref:paraneoplastic antigen Ma1 homolog n=1 Tax=Polyodon spathula TaxID=7913 RepID=UPI001B7E4E3B|nr:paraneoplastic antigen Ma1 homolog [Polyodon spathula]